VVALAAVKMAGSAIVKVAKSYTHIVQRRCRNGDGQADAKDGVRHSQRPDVARLKEDKARSQPPQQSQQRQNRVGQMRRREDDCRRNSGVCGAGDQANQAGKKITLQQKLLRQRPDSVSAEREYPLN